MAHRERYAALTEEAGRVKDALWRHAQDFPLYKEGQRLDVKEADCGMIVTYATTKCPTLNSTGFQMMLRPGNMGYIMMFGIAPEHRRKHYGTQLYKCLENFALEQGCRFIKASPTALGKKFFPSMGFMRIDGTKDIAKLLV